MSTLGVIESKMKKDPELNDKLSAMLEKMKSKAKEEMEDFYAEVTYKRQRDKARIGDQRDKKEKKEKKTKKQRKESSDDREQKAEHAAEYVASEDEEENEDSDNAEDDQDLFGDRFQNGKLAMVQLAPKEDEVGAPTEAANSSGNFHKNLQGMLQNAAVLGALSQANGW